LFRSFWSSADPTHGKWALVGLGGTLLAGTQVMRLLMEGIHTIYGDRDRPGFFTRQLRALLLLIPDDRSVAGGRDSRSVRRPLRQWLGSEFGKDATVQTWWAVFFHGVAILLAMIAVTIIYRWGAARRSKPWAASFPEH